MNLKPQTPNQQIIYRIPGMGADKRLFSEIAPITGFEFVDLEWQPFPKIKTLKDYAVAISEQIDTSKPFSLMGVSMGGMVCSELADMLNPEKVVIISSAKTSNEIPPMYKRLNFLGVTRLLNADRINYIIGNSSRFFGAMNKEQRELFYQMADNINIDFIVWSIKAILNWEKKKASSKIIHIHGTKDFVLPFENVKPTHIIERGDHMMVWNKSSQINQLLKDIFSR
ncbi:MAG: alpha/beta hydrolase [Flavobacteriales bacterium]|nr:alpha/beta hydrolase [Flavobacteriales bacterium]